MNETDFVRARTSDQIEIRRAEILRAAADLILENGFDNVSLNGIARHAGIAKSNLYRYFDSKEEIFFQVMLTDYADWFKDMVSRLEQLPQPISDKAIAEQLADSMVERERLCHFISVKASVIEKNLSAEAMARFSDILLVQAIDLANAFVTCLPHISREQVVLLLKATHAIIAGLWPMSQHDLHAEPTDDPNILSWRTDFHRDLKQTIYYLLAGLRAG